MKPSVRQPQQEAEPNGHRQAAQQPAADITQRSRSASVPLRRLLGLATLTPPQAAQVVVEVLALVQPDSESYGAFDADDVLLDEDGSIRIAAHTFTPGTAAAAADLARRLARNADRPAARRRPAQADLLSALTRCADGLAAGDLAGPLTELRRELEASGADHERLRGELAALVAVPLVRVGAEPAQPEPVGAAASDDQPQLDEPDPFPVTGVRRRLPGPLVAAAAVAVVAVVAIVTALLTIGGSPRAHHNAPPAAAQHRLTSPTPSVAAAVNTPRPVRRPAPLAAGPIARVTLTPAAACTPGAMCALTVQMWLRPPGLAQLSWHAVLVDRCTGRTRTLDSGSMVAEPGWQAPYTTVHLRLPRHSAMALLAVVDSPVSAASRPLYVPAGGGSCG